MSNEIPDPKVQGGAGHGSLGFGDRDFWPKEVRIGCSYSIKKIWHEKESALAGCCRGCQNAPGWALY